MKNKETVDKIKQTNLERYGTACSMNRSDLIEERSKKYQDPIFVAGVVEKRRETALDRYGVDHPMKTGEVQEKQKQVMQEKYGVDHPLQNKEIMRKTKQTNLERYGVENVAAVPEVRLKMAQATLEKYGVEHYNQLPEMKEYLRKNCREWLKESWQIGIRKSISHKLSISNTISQKIINGEWKQGSNRNGIRGYYRSSSKCKKQVSFFRSSFELVLHYYFDTSKEVEFYDYESFHIPYVNANGETRHYIPDFIVKYNSDDKINIIEVKPESRLDETINKIKFKAGYTYAEENDMRFVIWTEKMIKWLNIVDDISVIINQGLAFLIQKQK